MVVKLRDRIVPSTQLVLKNAARISLNHPRIAVLARRSLRVGAPPVVEISQAGLILIFISCGSCVEGRIEDVALARRG